MRIDVEVDLELVADVLLDTASAVLCAVLADEESCVAFESAVLIGNATETARLSAFDTCTESLTAFESAIVVLA